MDETELIECIAELEHNQWAHWTKYMVWHYTPDNLERWQIQYDTPYHLLTENEKESDREWARKVLSKLRQHNLLILEDK